MRVGSGYPPAFVAYGGPLHGLWRLAGCYAACGGPLRGLWRAATRPVAGRYAACFQGRYAANELTHSRYVTKAYHSNSVHSTRGRVEARPSSVGRISETKSGKSVTSNKLAKHVVCYMPCNERESIQRSAVVVRLLAPLELLAPHGRSRANFLAHLHRRTHPFAHPANDEQRIEEPRR